MPTRIELNAIVNPLITQQGSSDRITGTEIRQSIQHALDYVDQQDAALAAVDALKASIAYVDAEIAGVSGGTVELTTDSNPFTGSIKFDKLNRTYTVNSSDITGPITVDATGSVWGGGATLVVTEDGGGAPTFDAEFTLAPNPGTYDTTMGNSTAFPCTNISGSYVYGIIPLGVATIANTAPIASTIAIAGTAQEGQTLTGSYVYTDADSDAEGTSLKQWYRADDGSGLNRAAISGATGSTYVLVVGDVGKYIQFAVTPVAATGVTPGTQAVSSYTSAVLAIGANNAPTATSVAKSGTAQVGQTLTGTYVYADTESDVEGTSLKQWYRANDAIGTGRAAISGATNTTYVVQAGDLGKFIQYGVTPVAVTGTSPGTEGVSTYTAAVIAANVAPVASSVAFTGTETEGQTLTRTYTYTDADSDAEGVSTTKWYRADDAAGLNEAFITGATGSTYVLVAGDVGKFIRAGVTPVAATGVSPGTEAFSSYSGAIAAAAAPLTVINFTSPFYVAPVAGVVTPGGSSYLSSWEGDRTLPISTSGFLQMDAATEGVTFGFKAGPGQNGDRSDYIAGMYRPVGVSTLHYMDGVPSVGTTGTAVPVGTTHFRLYYDHLTDTFTTAFWDGATVTTANTFTNTLGTPAQMHIYITDAAGHIDNPVGFNIV